MEACDIERRRPSFTAKHGVSTFKERGVLVMGMPIPASPVLIRSDRHADMVLYSNPNGAIEQQNSTQGVFQLWSITPSGNGFFKLSVPSLNQPGAMLSLDVGNGGLTSGTQLIVQPSNQSSSQLWSLIQNPERPGVFRIAPADDEKLTMDVAGGVENPGTPIQLYPAQAPFASTNQEWHLDLIP
jgi:hypothetical protein